MKIKPELRGLEDFELNISGANGQEIPYIGYIEAEVKLPNSLVGIIVPLLVVKDTEYNKGVPAIVGTNIIRELSNTVEDDSENTLPDAWKTAADALNQSCLGTVKATK